MAFPPSLAVADFDGDGFYDLYVTQPDPSLPNALFHNRGGQSFEHAGSGLTKSADADSVALLFDVDGDGRVDIVQSRFGCHTVFLQTGPLAFTEHAERFAGYCSNPNGVNFADFDRDGRLDLVFANYYPTTPLADYLPLNHVFGYAGPDYWGGISKVLYGRSDGFGARCTPPDHDGAAPSPRPSGGHLRQYRSRRLSRCLFWPAIIITTAYS